MNWRAAVGSLLALATSITLTVCQNDVRPLPPCDSSPELPALAGKREVTIAAAGDIADCSNHDAHKKTAALVETLAPDAVLALGDLAYPNANLDDFVDCYGSSWGKFRSFTRPAIGNHEYHTEHAGPFFAYFCGAVGPAFRGYYSFELGAWHVVALNSNCGDDLDLPPGIGDEFGGCDAASPQAHWLEADLGAHPNKCTLAMWHHPRFTSGKQHGNGVFMTDLWRILHRGGVDVVLQGHVHNYERFAPLDADGNLDPEHGIRSFVIGTGGAPSMTFGATAAASEAQRENLSGVMQFVLSESGYRWNFHDVDGAYTDEGSAECH